MIRKFLSNPTFQSLFLCFLILVLLGCNKQTEQIHEDSNETFFARYLPEKNSAVKTDNYQYSYPYKDIIDSIITALKEKDKVLKFSNKIVENFGVPKWDYHLQIKNSNGYNSIIVPIFNEKKKVNLLLFLYRDMQNSYKVKFVVRNSTRSKLKKHGDKDGKTFTENTLNGLFEVFEKDITNNAPPSKNKEEIKHKSNSVTVYMYCWYYTWSDGMNFGISNTQCSYTIVFTPSAYFQLDSGGGWGLPEFDMNSGGGGNQTPQQERPDCATFENKVLDILNNEGGYTNNSNDPGGATNKGISWSVWEENAQEILGVSPTLYNLQHLTDDQAKILYKKLYWDPIHADQIVDGDLRFLLFDFFVNSGGNAVKVLQRTINETGGSPVAVDGVMGANTLNAINAINPITLYNNFKSNRQLYYNRLAAKSPKLATFLNGWTNRVNRFVNKTETFNANVNC